MVEAVTTNIQVTIRQAEDLLERALKARLVPMLAGSPGAGKSALVHQIASKFNLKVIDLRLAQCDPTDLLGFPTVDKITGRGRYAPMETFPLQGDPVPEGYDGWLLFLDELTSASKAVQAAGYKIILDRMVGDRRLHDKVAIVGAGNLETDNAIVEEMSTALQSRLVHLELRVDADEWVDWAMQNDVDHRITSYIKFKPSMVYTFRPDHTDKTYACPRTWEFTSRLIKNEPVIDLSFLPLLAGTISQGVAREFISFCNIFTKIPTVQEILKNPNMDVPTEPSVLYALTGAIANHANQDNVHRLMEYIQRMPVEFCVVTLREIVRRDKEMLQHASIRNWIAQSATELF